MSAEWIESLIALGSAAEWRSPLASLLAAFALGQLLSWTYERTFSGLSYSRSFTHAIVLVAIAAATLVRAMQASLLAGLGLFGILSMIRFRTDLKTPRDLVFVMGAACVGVASGVSAFTEAVLGATLFAGVALFLALGRAEAHRRFDALLRFQLPAEHTDGQDVEHLLERHCRARQLVSVKDLHGSEFVEQTLHVKFFRESDGRVLLAGLREVFGAQQVQLLLQDASEEF